MTALILFYAFLLGLVIGSFLNVCIYRIPKGLSVAWPPSACMGCKNRIKWYDNIPVLSWFVLRGKCRNCGCKISVQYPVVEFFTALLTVLFVWRFGLTWWTPCVLFSVYCLIALSVIDIKTFTIPDRFSIGLTVIALGISFLNPAFTGAPFERFISALIAGAVGFFGLWGTALLGQFIFRKEAMGGGDIKLMAAIGALSGLHGVVNSLVIGSFAGLIYFGVMSLLKKQQQNGTTIPFGPFLSLGLLFNLYFPGMALITLLGN